MCRFHMTAFLYLFENERKNKKYDFIIGVDDLLLAHILYARIFFYLCLLLISAYIFFNMREICKSEGYSCLRVRFWFFSNAYISMWMSLLGIVRKKVETER